VKSGIKTEGGYLSPEVMSSINNPGGFLNYATQQPLLRA